MEEDVEEVKADDQRIVTERKLRAVPVLLLSCVVFALATAAFAWTTLRVHDRQTSAEANEKAVAFLLGTPDLRSAQHAAAGGGSVAAFYSPKLRQVAVTGHDLPSLGGGKTYEFWFRSGPGAPPEKAGTSRFNGPQNDMVVVQAKGLVSSLVVTVERSGGADTPSGSPVAELSFG